jgi:hypothetical protein
MNIKGFVVSDAKFEVKYFIGVFKSKASLMSTIEDKSPVNSSINGQLENM